MCVIILNSELNYRTYVHHPINQWQHLKSPSVATVWILNEISYLHETTVADMKAAVSKSEIMITID